MRILINLVIWIALIQNASAGTIKVNFEFTDILQVNYKTQSYEPSIYTGPLSGSVIFEDTIRASYDYGYWSRTEFGSMDGIIINSPFTPSVIGTNPFGDEFPSDYQSAHGLSIDNPSRFYEYFNVVAGATKVLYQNDTFWDYHFSLELARTTPQQGGNGLNDYFYTSDSIFEYLVWFMENGEEFYISQYWVLRDNVTYLDGFGWFSSNGRVTSVQRIGDIPEPNMFIIFIFSLYFFLSIARPKNSPK